MARKPRVQFAGGTFHVYARRVDRKRLFVDDADFARYAALLHEVAAGFGWTLVSFCLMPNHVHILVTLSDANLDRGMKKLHETYVRWFNDRHKREGRLFEHRYHSRVVADELYYVTAVRYIEMNPVEAGLCDTPEEWPWSTRGEEKLKDAT